MLQLDSDNSLTAESMPLGKRQRAYIDDNVHN